VIGDGVHLRALKAVGSIELGPGVTVERWIDAGGRLSAGDGSDLGARATAGDEIILGAGVRFHLVSAPRIVVGAAESDVVSRRPASSRPIADFGDPKGCRTRADGALLTDDDFIVPDGISAAGDLVARGSIRVGFQATVRGSVHSEADVVIADEGVIEGSVYAERTLQLGQNGVISEHAVTAGSAIIGRGARVGSPGRVTTLLADRAMELGRGAVLYGRIVSAYGGTTRAAEDAEALAGLNQNE